VWQVRASVEQQTHEGERVSRLPIVVRDAEPEDASALIELWGSCVDAVEKDTAEGIGAGAWREPKIAESAAAISTHNADPVKRLLVALLNGAIVGVVAVRLQAITPIHCTQTMVVSDLHIGPRFRRKSVASVLMSAAVSWAEEHDCELVLTTAPASSRDAHRFLTRLGFGQVAVVRGAQTSALRSRFVGMATSSKDTGRLIAVRRTLRRRQRSAHLAFLTSEPGVPES